jgi:hypothetical protein
MQTAIQLSQNAGLSTSLGGIEDAIMRAAHENVAAMLPEGHDYGALEVQSIEIIEALKLTHGLDMTAVILRGRLIHKFEEGGFAGVYPGESTDLVTIARLNGISLTDLSNTRTLYDVIFPWIEENLPGTSVAEMWAKIGKSGFVELLPVLRALITGEQTGSATVRGSVDQLLNDAFLSVNASGDPLPADEAEMTTLLRTTAINRLLDLGAELPVREVRHIIRPVHTPNIATIIISNGDRKYAVMKLDEDQDLMLHRLLGNHLSQTQVPADQYPEQITLFRRVFSENE